MSNVLRGGFIKYGSPLPQITKANQREWLVKVSRTPRLVKQAEAHFNTLRAPLPQAPRPLTPSQIRRDPKAAWRRVFEEEAERRGKTEFQQL